MSLGDLVDRLSIVNLKLWHVQSTVQIAEKAATGLGAEIVSRQVRLNAERNRLIAEIDQTQGDPPRVWEKL